MANARGRKDALAGFHIGGSQLTPVFIKILRFTLLVRLDFHFSMPWLLEAFPYSKGEVCILTAASGRLL